MPPNVFREANLEEKHHILTLCDKADPGSMGISLHIAKVSQLSLSLIHRVFQNFFLQISVSFYLGYVVFHKVSLLYENHKKPIAKAPRPIAMWVCIAIALLSITIFEKLAYGSHRIFSAIEKANAFYKTYNNPWSITVKAVELAFRGQEACWQVADRACTYTLETIVKVSGAQKGRAIWEKVFPGN